jgi:PIN domain nuclease of toxin-antitoxin system
MDIVASIVQILAPCLPFLLKVGNKAVEGASEKVGEDVWTKAQAIWAKLHPKVEAKEAAKEAATDLAENPEDKNLQTVLQVQLNKIFDADKALAEEIAKIFQETKSADSSVSLNAQSYDESIQINTAGDVNQPNYDLSRNINSPK